MYVNRVVTRSGKWRNGNNDRNNIELDVVSRILKLYEKMYYLDIKMIMKLAVLVHALLSHLFRHHTRQTGLQSSYQACHRESTPYSLLRNP